MSAAETPRQPGAAPVTLAHFLGYFLCLGSVGFGGPIALVAHMQRDLVERRGWITRDDFLEGLALSQLAPGPLAAQLAIYLGYVRAGWVGATLTGVAFVGPSFVMVLLLAAAYVRYGGLPWIGALFYGIGAAVIGIIARSAGKLALATLRRDATLWSIFAVLGVTTAVTGREMVPLFILAGLVPLLIQVYQQGRIPDFPRSFLPCRSRTGSGGLSGRSCCSSARPDCLSLAAGWRSCPFSTEGSCSSTTG